MKKSLLALALIGLISSVSVAQKPRLEENVEKQRAAVAAWTTCIADENPEEVGELLYLDFRSDEYRSKLDSLSKKLVSSECFNAMPRSYRRIRLGGLPFAGGLSERMIERDKEPLLNRLSMAAIGAEAPTYSYTDRAAMCTARGAPHLVAVLFKTEVSSDEEATALQQIQPVLDVCTAGDNRIEASPLALRSMLASASYRLLAAQKENADA